MPLGLYISVPFCRTKCTYCNFASDVFSGAVFTRYVERVCQDIANARSVAGQMGGTFESAADSLYLGGGTPSVLDVAQLEELFVTIRQNFELAANAEITVECAPGTLSSEMIDCLCGLGVNRVSLGVQSFVDPEAAAVGRLHKSATVLDDIGRLRSAGIANINIDLIAGLPHQTDESWAYSLEKALAAEVPHVSVYMLEVDHDSRLGRELIAGGTKYHAHFVPDEDAIAGFYETACAVLSAAGVQQYEISNFARSGCESQHNLKYWTRQPYLGFGVDAHSMLYAPATPVDGAHEECGRLDAVRFSTPDALAEFTAAKPLTRTPVSLQAASEETLFLGLRLNRGVDLAALGVDIGSYEPLFAEFGEAGLLEQAGSVVRLTARGRLLSNEVFERIISLPGVPA